MLFPFSVWRFFSAFTSPVCISFGPASSRTSTWFARGWPLNTLDIRQGVRIRIWHQWNDFTFTDLPWNNLSLPQGVKGQAARLSTHSCRALQAPLGSHFCCFDSQLLLLRLAKMKKIPLQATHGCARDYTQATPAPVGSLSPVPAAMLGGGWQLHEGTLAGTSQHHCWELNLGSSYVLPRLTSHLRSWGGSTAKRRAARQEKEGCWGKRACAAQHTAWAEWQLLWDFSMAHLALFPVLLLNLIPTSGYRIEKEGKNMRLEVGRRETTAPAQGSTKFRSHFKLQYFKKTKQNNQNFSKWGMHFPSGHGNGHNIW